MFDVPWVERFNPRVQLMERFDKDGDGALNFEEFVEWQAELQATVEHVQLSLDVQPGQSMGLGKGPGFRPRVPGLGAPRGTAPGPSGLRVQHLLVQL